MIGIDLMCRRVIMASYLYYRRNVNVISDAENDTYVEILRKNWASVPERYKRLLDPDNTNGEILKATTVQCLYTQLVEAGAIAWLKAVTGEKLQPRGYGYKLFNTNLKKEQ